MLLTLPISEIDLDNGHYRVTVNAGIDDLAVSIREVGLINPPLVRTTDQGIQIVSGFRRIGAMVFNGQKETVVRMIPAQEDWDLTCALYAISENAFQRELTPLEQARGVKLLAKHLDIQAIAHRSRAVFNTGMNAVHVERLLCLVSLPMELQLLLASDRLSMTAALKIHGLDPEIQAAYARVFSIIRVGLNKQIEIITHIHETAAREGLMPLDVIHSPGVTAILTDDSTDESRKGNLLRTYLFQRRYPEISRKHHEFEVRAKALGLGAGMRLDPPVNFEAIAYSLLFQFASHEQFKKQLKTLQAMADNPIMEQLFQ